MDKSPEAFRTISEVADFLETPAHVLRFWESRFPQIRPVKRAGGRRYYRPGDVALLAGIKRLLHDEGMTIRGVQKILREQGIRHVASLGSGDSPAALLDSDIEAVLSAEYGPAARVLSDQMPSDEALQTAQIISLETALNRHDPARGAPPVQGDLWPGDPADRPEDADAAMDSAEAWPGDPALAPNVIAAEAAREPGSGESHDDASSEAMPADPPMPDEAAPHGDDVAAVSEHASPTPPETAIPAPAVDEDRIANVSSEAAPVESQDAGADVAPVAESDELVATVAALLRRVTPAQAEPVEAELARLHSRLMDLRGRVADAARRRAK
ncbi:MerR family transcriptional regulator [Paragemmobacter ruber]|uniref:MerR family transcriptional regulator n=1 Tax=Paragemmobacter ruber TaxID=1985673 RepID=UPI00191C3156|nr:MerR family transcriptional regulator [Rhodobacter ruber]